jgi:hypothetical protein
MSGSRLGPVAAVLFVALWIAATFVSRTPDGSKGVNEAAAYYTDSTKSVMMVVAAYLFVIAALVFLGFLVCLRGRLAEAEGGDGPLTTLGFTSGAIAAAMMLVGTFALVAVPGGVEFGGLDAPTNGEVTLFIQQMGWGAILVGAMFPAALTIFVTSIIARRTGALPGWIVWLGFVAAIVLLFAAIWIPQIALLIWVLVVGFALRKPGPGAVASST